MRGSYDIIQLMKDRLKKNGLEDSVELSAAFCLGKCTQGVSVKVDDEIICGVSKENFDEVFNQYILKK